ncbi:peptidase [Streptomyces albofaciens JCM 4342]|uniref:M48 family metallopeptidase n=1 Tax=Streptomyces albofaciens TaxID=66866 RepID=UPI00123B6ECF|nr:M48 family metallopeptidase [Streptomyces albofaciens]KAA6223863.1 peptidase [Streptomyces albofaciens JCM 4342]
MGTSLRALRALVLLAGFYVLALAVLALLTGAGLAAWAWASPAAALTVTVLCVLLGLPVLRGVFTLGTAGGNRKRGDGHDAPETDGLAVTGDEQPELWRAVRSLAERTGTRAPDAILLTEEVNAAVREDTRLLGLLPGRRRLYLGVPLLIGLTEPQLHSVIAHELGHYGNADTRLAGVTLRGRDSVLRTVEGFQAPRRKLRDRAWARQGRPAGEAVRKGRSIDLGGGGRTGFGYGSMARPFQAYARFYLRATSSVGRGQELAADRVAARVAGRDATASALREIAVLDAVHDFYLNEYVALGTRAALLPPPGEVCGGLRHLLADPELRSDMAELRGEPGPGHGTPYDSHPPVAERIRLIEAMPDDGRAADPARPALALLHEAGRVLAEVERVLLTPEALAMERADWPELIHRAAHALAEAGAEALRTALAEAGAKPARTQPQDDREPADSAGGATATGAARDLAALLDATDAGRLWQVADHLPKSPEAARASGRAAREFLRPALEYGSRSLAELALVEAAGARWALSWSTPPRLRLPAGRDLTEPLAAAVRAALADDPDTAPLRALLAH